MLAISQKKTAAYSIMEVLIAAAIFSVVILLIYGTYVLTLKLTRDGREVSIASNLAEKMIDDIRATPFEDIALNSNPNPIATSKLPGGQTKTYVALFENNDKLKEVRVVIYWDNRPESNAIEVTSVITQGGLTNVGAGAGESQTE
jgi:Tfp pilus assembly protein PilV